MTPDEELIERFHVLSERLDRAWAKFMARKVPPKEGVVIFFPGKALKANPQREEEPK